MYAIYYELYYRKRVALCASFMFTIMYVYDVFNIREENHSRDLSLTSLTLVFCLG